MAFTSLSHPRRHRATLRLLSFGTVMRMSTKQIFRQFACVKVFFMSSVVFNYAWDAHGTLICDIARAVIHVRSFISLDWKMPGILCTVQHRRYYSPASTVEIVSNILIEFAAISLRISVFEKSDRILIFK